ncbi:hypothetical protein ID866_11602 [Astraeus odoratus]|nr:hypothetical protein ID866_11602 [Astraeus odoratus]
MIMGTPAVKITDWTKVPDEELVTNLDDTDLVKWKHQVEEVEKCQKEEEVRQQKEAEEKWKQEAKERKQVAAAEAKKWQWADSEMCEAGFFMHHTNWGQEAFGMAAMLPQGGERKKWVKKVANDDDDDEIVILSDQKTKQQGGGKMLKEISDNERLVSVAQSNGCKMQWHHLLMEGLVGQQQLLVSKLVEMASTAGSGRAKEVIKDPEEPQEP